MKRNDVELVDLSFVESCSRSLDCTLFALKNNNVQIVAKLPFSTSISTGTGESNNKSKVFVHRC